MMYFANPTGMALQYMRAGILGFIDTPAQGNVRPKGVIWCADNGCFGKGYPGDEKWLKWLEKHSDDRKTCRFATAPDIVGAGEESLERSMPFLKTIREIGYPAALVAQDGFEDVKVPWKEFDCLFIGGERTPNPKDEWKLSPAARELTKEARWRKKWVHMGRVNSGKRVAIAHSWGCHSVDGTYITRGPDINLPKVLQWVDKTDRNPTLFNVWEM